MLILFTVYVIFWLLFFTLACFGHHSAYSEPRKHHLSTKSRCHRKDIILTFSIACAIIIVFHPFDCCLIHPSYSFHKLGNIVKSHRLNLDLFIFYPRPKAVLFVGIIERLWSKTTIVFCFSAIILLNGIPMCFSINKIMLCWAMLVLFWRLLLIVTILLNLKRIFLHFVNEVLNSLIVFLYKMISHT